MGKVELRQNGVISVRQRFPIGAVEAFPTGRLHSINVNGRSIFVMQTVEGFFAVLNQCPHMGLRLDNGTLLGKVIVCLWHGAQFDLETGVCLRWAVNEPPEAFGEICRPLTTFPVIVDGSQLYVELEV